MNWPASFAFDSPCVCSPLPLGGLLKRLPRALGFARGFRSPGNNVSGSPGNGAGAPRGSRSGRSSWLSLPGAFVFRLTGTRQAGTRAGAPNGPVNRRPSVAADPAGGLITNLCAHEPRDAAAAEKRNTEKLCHRRWNLAKKCSAPGMTKLLAAAAAAAAGSRGLCPPAPGAGGPARSSGDAAEGAGRRGQPTAWRSRPRALCSRWEAALRWWRRAGPEEECPDPHPPLAIRASLPCLRLTHPLGPSKADTLQSLEVRS